MSSPSLNCLLVHFSVTIFSLLTLIIKYSALNMGLDTLNQYMFLFGKHNPCQSWALWQLFILVVFICIWRFPWMNLPVRRFAVPFLISGLISFDFPFNAKKGSDYFFWGVALKYIPRHVPFIEIRSFQNKKWSYFILVWWNNWIWKKTWFFEILSLRGVVVSVGAPWTEASVLSTAVPGSSLIPGDPCCMSSPFSVPLQNSFHK